MNIGEERMEEAKHAIFIIRNKDGKYLQYDDIRWRSFLFLNCKIEDSFDSNQIKKFLWEKLGMDKDSISVQFLKDMVHQKISVPSNKKKKYHHYFYLVEFDLGKNMMKAKFKYQDISYQWFTMEELQKNKRIQDVNQDIVSYVENLMKERM